MINKKGFTLIEILVAITLFAILGIIITQSVANSLKNTKKSDSISKVRENLDYSLSNIERLMRNVETVNKTTEATNPSTSKVLYYYDKNHQLGKFACITSGSDNYIASGSADVRLTSNDVNLDCNIASGVFQYNLNSASDIVSVTITLKGNSKIIDQQAVVQTSTLIKLRNY
jgi:prepilin-type N-terminal cleavage/methylation domain-containing protein